MKKILITLVAVMMLGAIAWASPFYFEYNQDITSTAPAGDWQAGLAFAFSDTTELDHLMEHPDGSLYQFSTVTFSGDLFVGNSDAWTWPGNRYAGFECDLGWNYLSLGLDTRLDFDPATSDWPWISPTIDAWATDVALSLQFTEWASGWAGINLNYNYTERYFEMIPFFGFRLGNQG